MGVRILILGCWAICSTCFGSEPIFPGKASIQSTRDTVSSGEIFSVTYAFKEFPPGVYYVALSRLSAFEAVGEKVLRSRLDSGQTATVRFGVRLKDSLYSEIQEMATVVIGFSRSASSLDTLEGIALHCVVVSDWVEIKKAKYPDVPAWWWKSRDWTEEPRDSKKPIRKR